MLFLDPRHRMYYSLMASALRMRQSNSFQRSCSESTAAVTDFSFTRNIGSFLQTG